MLIYFLKISFLKKLIIFLPIKVILTLLKYLNLTQNGPKFLFSLKNLNDFNVWPHIIRTTWLANILCKFTKNTSNICYIRGGSKPNVKNFPFFLLKASLSSSKSKIQSFWLWWNICIALHLGLICRGFLKWWIKILKVDKIIENWFGLCRMIGSA